MHCPIHLHAGVADSRGPRTTMNHICTADIACFGTEPVDRRNRYVSQPSKRFREKMPPGNVDSY